MSSRRFLIVLFPVIAIVIYAAITYNGLINKEETVKKDWAEMQNVYQRRLDLIPNLVIVVKGSSEYEKLTLQRLAESRSKAGSVKVSSDPSAEEYQQQEVAQTEVASDMSRLVAIIEDYPDLKTSRSFIDLMAQLKGTEQRIKIARSDFNESIKKYNIAVRKFPSSLIAGIFGFRMKDGFIADPSADKAKEIKFSNN